MNNEQVINTIVSESGCDNVNQLSKYLSEKYDYKISRQMLYQLKGTSTMTVTHILLREALSIANAYKSRVDEDKN